MPLRVWGKGHVWGKASSQGLGAAAVGERQEPAETWRPSAAQDEAADQAEGETDVAWGESGEA